MMRPQELLDWTILMSAAALAVDRGTSVFTAGAAFGVEPARVRRARARLSRRGLDFDIESPPGAEFDNVMGGFWSRCAELRLGGRHLQFLTGRRPKPEPLTTPSPTGGAATRRGPRGKGVYTT